MCAITLSGHLLCGDIIIGRDVNRQQESSPRDEIQSVQCKMARVALGWGVRELAEAAQVATQTITRLEQGDRLKPKTVQAIRTAFEAAGIEFIPENGGGPGVRLSHRQNGK